MKSPIRVLLVDEHELFRAGLRSVLDKHELMEVVGEADDIDAGAASLDATTPDVVVLDISMSDGQGLEFVDVARGRSPETCIVALSSYQCRYWAGRALDAGCAGYLDKTVGIVEIAPAILAISRGRMIISLPRIVSTDPESGAPQTAPPAPHVELLSDREREVLRCLARGLTNQQAADELYLSVKTVETYRSRLTRKLGVRDRSQLYEYARSNGVLAESGAVADA